MAQPTSVSKVEFQDQRPYGEEAHRSAWLVRYDSVHVQTPDSSTSGTVTLSVAVDTVTGEPFCAFTESAPIWAGSGWPSAEFESRARERWAFAPARHGELRSTLGEVLDALWRWCGVDPRKAGQIVIRPRMVQSTLHKFDPANPDGPRLPLEPPCNMWIVEVLGTPIVQRHGVPLTTQVAVLRDGDLTYTGGMLLP